MADLSLKIAVKLLTKGFKNGVNDLVSMLRGLQMQFMAFTSTLGVGTVGLGNFLQRMREVAKETTSANIALKNVSQSSGEFAKHQEWLIGVSKKYGVQINTLTSGFAKFKAAADIPNMSLESQRKIFDSVARASVAFGLSSEDQRGVFMALQQMMSKGKVMAEELRLQLAERMPVAIQAMASALGVSVTEMDAMMKRGEVLSQDVLPRFAEELTKMIPNINLDNLNKSLTDLGNTFVEFTKKLNIEGKYKGLVEGINRVLQWVMNSTKGISRVIWAFIGSIFGKLGTNIFNYMKSSSEKATAVAEKTIADRDRAIASAAKAEERLGIRTGEHQAALEKQKALAADASAKKRELAAKRVADTERRLGYATLSHQRAVEKQKQAEALVTAEVIEQANMKNATSYQKFINGFKLGIKSLGASLKAFVVSNIWTMLLAGLSYAVSYCVQLYKEAKRIRELAETTAKELSAPLELTAQEQTINASFNILSDAKKYTDKEREGALATINNLLGTEYSLTDATNKKAGELLEKRKRYIAYLQAQQKLERAQSTVTSLTSEFDAWKKENPEWESDRGKKQIKTLVIGLGLTRTETTDELTKAAQKIQSFEDSIALAAKDVEEATAELAVLEKEFNKSANTTTQDKPEPETPAETELEKQQKKYAESLAELDAELASQLISEREYTRRKRDLIERAFVAAQVSGDEGLLGSDFYKGLAAEFGAFTHGELRKAEERLEDRITQYYEDVEEQSRLLKTGAITQEEYQKALRELSAALYRELSSIDTSGMSPAAYFAAEFERGKAALANASAGMPSYEPRRRDRTKDFGRTESGRLAEELKDAQHYADYLKKVQEQTLSDLTAEINAAMGKVTTIEEALQLARAKESVEELSKELRNGLWGGVRSTVRNVDGVVSAFERVGEVMSNADASGWEKIMTIWSALESVADTFMNIINVIQQLTKVTEMLTAAEKAAALVDTQATMTKVENTALGAAADTAATQTHLENASQVVAANTAKAGANAAADTSAIPFGWLAIPAVIAAVIGMFAALPKFAKGGIVGGNSRSGDKVLARLNSGEGVLTEQGLAGLNELADAAGARKTNINITGTLTARGRDLALVLGKQERYQKRVE